MSLFSLLAKHFPDYSAKQTNSSEQNWASHSYKCRNGREYNPPHERVKSIDSLKSGHRDALDNDILHTKTILFSVLLYCLLNQDWFQIDKPAHIILLMHFCPELLKGFLFYEEPTAFNCWTSAFWYSRLSLHRVNFRKQMEEDKKKNKSNPITLQLWLRCT